LLGTLVQEIARSKAEEKQPEALREMDWKLSNRVKEEIDGLADVRLAKASDQLKSRYSNRWPPWVGPRGHRV